MDLRYIDFAMHCNFVARRIEMKFEANLEIALELVLLSILRKNL